MQRTNQKGANHRSWLTKGNRGQPETTVSESARWFCSACSDLPHNNNSNKQLGISIMLFFLEGFFSGLFQLEQVNTQQAEGNQARTTQSLLLFQVCSWCYQLHTTYLHLLLIPPSKWSKRKSPDWTRNSSGRIYSWPFVGVVSDLLFANSWSCRLTTKHRESQIKSGMWR